MLPGLPWRARASLNSAGEGWLAGLALTSALAMLAALNGRHDWWPGGADLDALSLLAVAGFLSTTFLFVVAAWLLIALPFVLVLPHRGWVFTRVGAGVTGFALGVVTMGLYFGFPDDVRLGGQTLRQLAEVWPFLLWAGVSGGVGLGRYVRRVQAQYGCPTNV
jgi:hypothetical protein